ncbi:MAG: CDP-alcohol phosphatidyltransferase family protein [Acidimicrobiales bacterium]
MFDGRWRDTVDRGTGPVGRKLHKLGFTADVLTATGLLSATATAVAVGTGHLHLGIVLLVLTGLHDLLDGPVAKASGTSSIRGAFFDSVTDRVSDALLLGGVAWFLLSTHSGHVALLPFAVLGAASLVSYQRAKAESLGISAKGGLMERAERMILLAVGLLSASFLIPVLWVMLALTMVTALGRFTKVWQLAGAPVSATSERRLRRTRTAMRGERKRTTRSPSRWRARRQGELSSRSGRTWRARHAGQGPRQRSVSRRGT